MTYEMAVRILMADKVGDRQVSLFHRAKRFSYGAWQLLTVYPAELTHSKMMSYRRQNFFEGSFSHEPVDWPGVIMSGNMIQMRTWISKYPDKGFRYEYYRDL